MQGAVLNKPFTDVESHLVPVTLTHSFPHALTRSQGLWAVPLNPKSSPFTSFHLACTSLPSHHLASHGHSAGPLSALLLPYWPRPSFRKPAAGDNLNWVMCIPCL